MNEKKCLVSNVQKTPCKKMCFNIDRMKTFVYVKETSAKKSPIPKKPKAIPKKPSSKKPKVPVFKLADLLKKAKPSPKKPIESPDIKLADLLKKAIPKKPSPKKPKESPDIKLADLLKKAKPNPVARKPRCPNGSTRNKKTGKCIKK